MDLSQYSDIEEIIIRNLTGNTRKNDLKLLEEWRSQSYQNEDSYNLLFKMWKENTQQPPVPNCQALEKYIWEAAHRKDPDLKHKSKQPRILFKVAAAVAILCTVCWFALNFIPEKEIAQVQEELVYTYNPTGQKSKITLPDNSVIYLNSESSLSYQKGFSDSIRHIQLTGEAYFEVEPDINRPFVVETGDISTIALGTSFNVRNYPEECSIKVSLLSGKVRVTDSQAANEVLLVPFEQVKFLKGSRSLRMTQLEADHVSSWKDGVIYFRKSSFRDVIKTLERSYDVVIDTMGYSYKDWNYTGKFDNTSLEMVLTRIGYSESFKFNIDGQKIKIFDEPNN